MSGAADSEIVRRGRWQFNGWRSAAVLLAALSRVSVTKEAGAKPPRWQARKSTVSAIRPRPTRNARGESAGSSRARGNSARYATTGAKTKAERRGERRVVGLALLPGGSRLMVSPLTCSRTNAETNKPTQSVAGQFRFCSEATRAHNHKHSVTPRLAGSREPPGRAAPEHSLSDIRTRRCARAVAG
jgi:hypothetical protein